MHNDAWLRQFLEQQRDMGVREITFESEAAANLRAGPRAPSRPAPSEAKRAQAAGDGAPVDWRVSLRNADVSAEPAKPAAAMALPAQGIVIGSASHELFGGDHGAPASLATIAEQVRSCTKCPLYATAKNAVPGEGNPNAQLVCVGEAPGATEDETGRPFVGAAGQLLTKILAAINFPRDEVFICNVLKHRPPGNRNPMPLEVEACSPYLVHQLALIRPKVIIAFGTFAAQTLLQSKLAIGKMRGSVHRYYGTPLIVTYHPAALLRNPAWKRLTWEDVQLARQIVDHVG